MKTSNSHHAAGFTLIEMLIVTTVVGVLAGVTVPNLLSSRAAANEATVIATMRAITTAQFQFQSAGELDQNADAGYEYGTLGELAALEPLRGTALPISRNLLSSPVAMVDMAGRVTHHGYHFCLYLPNASGVGIVGTSANAGAIDPVQSRRFWTCLAWPVSSGSSGNRTFFVNQQGQVLKTIVPAYSGITSIPPAGAGLVGVPADEIATQNLATDMIGADGNQWVIVH